jgi:hypothetical protein
MAIPGARTGTDEVPVTKRIRGDGGASKGGAGLKSASPRSTVARAAIESVRRVRGLPPIEGGESTIPPSELDWLAWNPGASQGPALAAARVLRAVELATTRGDGDVMRALERVAQAYLEEHGADLSQERATAARALRSQVQETCKHYEGSTHTIIEIAAGIAGVIMVWLLINGDLWSADIRATTLRDGPDLSLQRVRAALERVIRVRGLADAEPLIQAALVAMGYPENRAKNFFSRLD